MIHHTKKSNLALWFVILFLLFAVVYGTEEPTAIAETEPKNPKGIEIPSESAEGLLVHLIYVHLAKSTGDSTRDEEFKKRVTETFSMEAGDPFRHLIADKGIKRVQNLPYVKTAQVHVYEAVPSGQIVMVVSATPFLEKAEGPKNRAACWPAGRSGIFPLFSKRLDRSLFSL